MSVITPVSRGLMLESLLSYAKRKIPFDLIRQLDAENKFPDDILKEMHDPEILGIHLLLIPREYGGLDAGTVDIYRVCHALGRIDLGIATSMFATFLGTDPIKVGATPEQKEKWFSKIAKDRLMVAYAATEADAGSDLVSLKTRAEHIVENGKITGYKITGSKQWISNGGIADIYTVLALAPGGPTWFVVEKTDEGFSAHKHEDKHGIRLSNTAALSFDGVIVSPDRMVGVKEGEGLQQAQAVFGYTRLMVAALGLGAGEEALETAAKYAQQRIQAGSPLAKKQGYMHKLIIPHAVRFEAARAYIDETARRIDAGNHELQTEGAIAKYYATEAGNRAAEDAIQAMGGYGYTRDFPVEKIKRDVKITCIYEGTNEIMEMTIYRGRWQEHLKTRGQYYAQMAQEMENIHNANAELGADSAALCLKSLSFILEHCRVQKLTRHQFVTFKLGELIAKTEAMRTFVRYTSQGITPEGVKYDAQTLQAMSRVNARQTAFEVSLEGAKLVLGAGTAQNGADFMSNLGIAQIAEKQNSITQDMDLIADKINEVFKH